MLLLLISLTLSKETTDSPPIEKGTPVVSQLTPYSSSFSSTTSMASYLTDIIKVPYSDAERFSRKMQYSSEGTLLEHTFSLSINPYNSEQRYVTRMSYFLKATKSNGVISLQVNRLKAYMNVRSVVITTSSKEFLWWEWDKQTTIAWRPLTSYELDSIYNSLENWAYYQLYQMTH